MSKITVGFLGTGNMGEAIIRGIVSVFKDNAEIYAYDVDTAKLDMLKEINVKAVNSEKELCEKCKYVFLAIKPQVFEAVLPKLAEKVSEDTVLVSIAAGISESYISKICGEKVHTVIVMPNTPFLLGEGATALAKGTYTTDEEFDVVKEIFCTGGIAEVVPMDKMKEIIAVNGSSPAFIYLYAKGFVDYAKSVGIDEECALRLFSKSLIGSAKMLTDSGKNIDELIKQVSSPGGTTIAGLEKLYEGNLTEDVDAACTACTNRAYELAK